MMRRTIVVGDAPVCGGSVLPYEAALSSTIHGHPVALIGGRVFFEGCHSVGIIAKAGRPRRVEFISEEALEGDVVVCHCPKPQPLMSTLQTTSYADDGAGTHAMATPEALAAMSLTGGHADLAAAKMATGPVDVGGVLREVDDARAEEAARRLRMAAG